MKYDFKETFHRCEDDYLSPVEREHNCKHNTIVSNCCDSRIFDQECSDCGNRCWEFCEDCELLLDL